MDTYKITFADDLHHIVDPTFNFSEVNRNYIVYLINDPQ